MGHTLTRIFPAALLQRAVRCHETADRRRAGARYFYESYEAAIRAPGQLMEQHEDIHLLGKWRLTSPATVSSDHTERKNPDNSTLRSVHVR